MRARSGSLARWGPAGRVARPCASPKLGVAPSRFEDQTRVLARQTTRACFLRGSTLDMLSVVTLRGLTITHLE